MASYESNASGPQSSLFDLGHDPLMMILDQIPIMEQIRLERVCRSAGSVVAASLRRLTQLDFSEFAQKNRENYQTFLHLPNGVLPGILQRFREQVRSLKCCKINRACYGYDTTREILTALIQFQPFNQLQKLYLDGLTIDCDEDCETEENELVNVKMLQTFLSDPSMKSLRVLECGGYSLDFSESAYETCVAPIIESVLTNCLNLVELKLEYYQGVQSLEGLFPICLESIEIGFLWWDGGSEEESIQMEKLFGITMPSLKSIKIGNCASGMSFGPDFAANVPNLKTLDLGRKIPCWFGDLKGILETELMKLSLRALDTSVSLGMESLMLDLPASLRPCRLLETLKILHLPEYRDFSNKTVEMIRLFVNLEELSLEELSGATDEFVLIDPIFQAFPKLTILNVKGCGTFVLDSTLKTIGGFCPRIKSLEVSDCERITDSGIQSMIQALDENPDRADTEGLEINVRGTKISLESNGPVKFISCFRSNLVDSDYDPSC